MTEDNTCDKKTDHDCVLWDLKNIFARTVH